MGMLPLDKLKQHWGQDMTSEYAIGQIIQHLEALSLLVKEKSQSLKSLTDKVEKMKEENRTLHSRVKLLEQQWGRAQREVNQESPGTEQEPGTAKRGAGRKSKREGGEPPQSSRKRRMEPRMNPIKGQRMNPTRLPRPPPMRPPWTLTTIPPPPSAVACGTCPTSRMVGPRATISRPRTMGRCSVPPGTRLRPKRASVLPNGDEQIRFVAHVPDCRGCDHRAACLTPQSVSPRSVQGPYRVLPSPLDVASLPDGVTDPPVFRHAAIWWCDLEGRAVRRDFVAHLRRQPVTITVIPGEAPVPSSDPVPWIITSKQRAHRRERFLRNARPASAPRSCFHITGVSPALTAAIGGIVKSP